MTGIMSWIIMGLVAGYLARFLHPGRDNLGCLMTMALGIAGALLGGLIGVHLLHIGTVHDFSLKSILLATGGAVILLIIHKMIVNRPGV